MPWGVVLARYYRPWEWGFELCFARGREFAHQKNCPRGRSGLELTDTLLHVRSNYLLKTVEVSFRTDIFQILIIGPFPHLTEKYLSLNFFGHPFWSRWESFRENLLIKSRNRHIFEKFKLNRNLQTIPFKMMYNMSMLRHQFSNERWGAP